MLGAQRERDDGGGKADEQRFDDHQPREASAARTEREPDRELTLPAMRPQQLQHRDVGARHQQHQRAGDADGSEHGANAGRITLLRGDERNTPVGGHRCAAGADGLAADERGDPLRRDHRAHAATQPHLIGISGRAQRRHDVGVGVDVPEVARQDAGDRERLRLLRTIAHVGLELSPDDVRIALEAAHPQAMADERRERSPRLKVGAR